MKVLILVKPQSAGALSAAEELAARLSALGAESALYSWPGGESLSPVLAPGQGKEDAGLAGGKPAGGQDYKPAGCKRAGGSGNTRAGGESYKPAGGQVCKPAGSQDYKPAGYKPADLAISLGGDGTVLYAARMISPYNIPLIPVNIGTLGFIAAVRREEVLDIFTAWRDGKDGGAESKRLMLEVRIERGGKIIFTESCLNDAVISAGGIAKTIRLDAALAQGEAELELASYRSDGLIIATPTGSTAYSGSAGGPILDPETEVLILTPICPFTLLHRPLVIPTGSTLAVSIPDEQRSSIILTIDGQITRKLLPLDRILVRQAAFKTRLIAAGRISFYKALHTKLAWPRPAAL